MGQRLTADERAERGHALFCAGLRVEPERPEIRARQPLAYLEPELRLQRADGQVATIGAFIDVVAQAAAGQHAGAARLVRAGRRGLHRQQEGQPGQRAAEHGDIQELPAAAACARQQRGQDGRERGHRAAANVGDLHRQRRRHLLHRADAQHAAFRHVVQIVPRAMTGRAGLAVTADGAVDQARVDRRELVIIKRQARHDAGAKRLDQDIGRLHQLEKNLDIAGRFEIKAEAALAPVERGEVGAEAVAVGVAQPAAQVANARRLNLDDISAQVGQPEGGKAAGQVTGQVENANAFECEHKGPFIERMRAF